MDVGQCKLSELPKVAATSNKLRSIIVYPCDYGIVQNNTIHYTQISSSSIRHLEYYVHVESLSGEIEAERVVSNMYSVDYKIGLVGCL